MSLMILHVAALCALVAFSGAAFFAPLDAPGGAARRVVPMALVALAGTAAVVWVEFSGGWRPGLAPALWVTAAATMALFAAGALGAPAFARLGVLLGPYLVVLAALAMVWSYAEGRATPVSESSWLDLHIAISVATYALFTLAAVAGTAVFLQERALKARKPTRVTAMLPAVADAERLQRKLMIWAGVVLGLGLLSGMAIEYVKTGQLVEFTHKTVFALSAFAVIVVLIVVEHASGLAGKRAARFLLLAYLFLTLAYPGVKFVTDVLMAGGGG